MLRNRLRCSTHRRYRCDPWVGKIPWREAMGRHSSILAWRIPWIEEPGELQSMESQESDMTEAS